MNRPSLDRLFSQALELSESEREAFLCKLPTGAQGELRELLVAHADADEKHFLTRLPEPSNDIEATIVPETDVGSASLTADHKPAVWVLLSLAGCCRRAQRGLSVC